MLRSLLQPTALAGNSTRFAIARHASRHARCFSSSISSGPSTPSPSKGKQISTTLGCCLLTGAALYTTMTTQHADELLDQKQSLLGASEADIAAAKAELDNLPVVRAARESSKWHEIEAYGHLKGNAKMQSLTATTLRGKGKIIISPILFYNKSKTEVLAVVHLGGELCGHAGIVHGGLIATLLDEILACVAIPVLPYNIGYTANLNIDYRKPLKADQWVVLHGRLDRVEGRKAYVEAWIESADGTTKFSEAKSLYIGPKSPLG